MKPSCTDWKPPEDPPRPSRDELAATLRNLAGGEDCTVSRDIAPPCMQFVRLASGWRLAVWWLSGCDGGSLGPLSGAIAPDGRRWIYGCDRWPDWHAAEQAIILDPLRHLVTPLERAAIEAVLRAAPLAEQQPHPPIAPQSVDEIWTAEELEVMGGG